MKSLLIPALLTLSLQACTDDPPPSQTDYDALERKIYLELLEKTPWENKKDESQFCFQGRLYDATPGMDLIPVRKKGIHLPCDGDHPF